MKSYDTMSFLVDVATQAGHIALSYFGMKNEIYIKDDNTPFTIADRHTQDFILTKLHERFPHVRAIGEEGFKSYPKKKAPCLYWLIDPIDGTKEFIRQSGEFTVNIALIENKSPVMGVIRAPALDMTYAALEGSGSYKVEQGDYRKIGNSTCNDIIAISKSSEAGKLYKELYNRITKYKHLRSVSLGSSLKFCYVAEGICSLYLRDGRTMFWDSAAGHVIVKESGGCVTKWESGDELTYDPMSKSFENPSFMVYRPEWRNILVRGYKA